jgi:hypothetical protein
MSGKWEPNITGQGLFTSCTFLQELLIVARSTEHIVVMNKDFFLSQTILTEAAGETGLEIIASFIRHAGSIWTKVEAYCGTYAKPSNAMALYSIYTLPCASVDFGTRTRSSKTFAYIWHIVSQTWQNNSLRIKYSRLQLC